MKLLIDGVVCLFRSGRREAAHVTTGNGPVGPESVTSRVHGGLKIYVVVGF